MKVFENIERKAVIGMIHLQALPGSPLSRYSVEHISSMALNELELYQKAGLDCVIVENMHDVPYLKRDIPLQSFAAFAIVASRLRAETDLPLGIQVLAGANKAALVIAKVAGLDFIRAEGFVYGHLADEGYMESDAGELLRYRKELAAEDIGIFCDIKKKHASHAITGDLSIGEVATAAEFFRSDGLIVTGSSTGLACDPKDLREVRQASKLPLLIGSGIRVDNLKSYWNLADAFVVGSYFKEDGVWSKSLSPKRISAFMQKVSELRA